VGAHRRIVRVLLLSLLLAAAPGLAKGAGLAAGVFDPPRPAPRFALSGSDGAELSLERYRGKVVILAFGFTSCPTVCPTTLATLAQARQQLGAEAEEVQVVYITVDPERDDAARMREYLAKFDPTFVGGTGTPAELASVRERYGVAAQATGVGDAASIAHSSFTFLIDRAGALRALMPYGHPADDYAHDVRILLGR
jgi:protein SCO1/2